MKTIAKSLLTNLNLKKPALRLYFFVTNTRESMRLKFRAAVLPGIARRRRRHGVLAVDICTPHGLGSKLEWSLELMAYCEEHNLAPRFRFSYPDSPTDYFEPFFYVRNGRKDSPAVKYTRVGLLSELGLGKDYDKELTIDYAHRLIGKYLGIKENIQAEVDAFCATHFGHAKVLGVHYRSTDKVGEAPAVPFETVKRNIEHYIEKFPETGAVFLSTDDDRFKDYLAAGLTSRPLIVREDHFRSKDDSSIHHNKQVDRYELNKDALINLLLLSKCSALLKSSSFLSDWSKLFNPEMPVIMLNRPFDHALWFPAREICKGVLYEPV